MSPFQNILLLVVGAVLMVAGYVPYIRGILSGRTKPHLFTWIVWTALTGIGAGVQFDAGAVSAAVITAMSTAGCLFVSLLSLRYGERHFASADYISLGAAIAALIWWRLADNPLMAVVFVIGADLFGFFPTIRKSFLRPYEETVSIYGLNGLRYVMGLFTIVTWTTEAWLFPAYVAASQLGFAALLLVLRRKRA